MEIFLLFFNLGSFDPLNSRKLIGCMIDVLLFRNKKAGYGMDDFINKMEMRLFKEIYWLKAVVSTLMQ